MEIHVRLYDLRATGGSKIELIVISGGFRKRRRFKIIFAIITFKFYFIYFNLFTSFIYVFIQFFSFDWAYFLNSFFWLFGRLFWETFWELFSYFLGKQFLGGVFWAWIFGDYWLRRRVLEFFEGLWRFLRLLLGLSMTEKAFLPTDFRDIWNWKNKWIWRTCRNGDPFCHTFITFLGWLSIYAFGKTILWDYLWLFWREWNFLGHCLGLFWDFFELFL